MNVFRFLTTNKHYGFIVTVQGYAFSAKIEGHGVEIKREAGDASCLGFLDLHAADAGSAGGVWRLLKNYGCRILFV